MCHSSPQQSGGITASDLDAGRRNVTTANSAMVGATGLYSNYQAISAAGPGAGFSAAVEAGSKGSGFLKALGPVASGVGGAVNTVESITRDDGFANRGFDASGDAYAQGTQGAAGLTAGGLGVAGLLGSAGAAAAAPYAAAAAAGIGLGRRGQGTMERWGLEEHSAGGIWDSSTGANGGDSWTRSAAGAGWDAGHDLLGDNLAGDIAGGVMGTVSGAAGALGTGAALIGGGLLNVGAGAVSLLTSW